MWRFFWSFSDAYLILQEKNLTFYVDASFYSFIKRKGDFAALTLTWNKSIIRRAEHEKGAVEIITLATRV